MVEIKNQILKNIWEDRYKKGEETIEENIERVLDFVIRDNETKDRISSTLHNGYFLPAGRTMSNAGIGKNLTLNNCFVAPKISDSLEDIFDKVKLGAVTHQKGGGIGYDFSLIRPNGTPTSNDAVASGVVSFMDVFNAQTAIIMQGSRRGANMGVLNIYHMDINEYINAKSTDGKRLEHFNMSVMVDDDFMIAVENDSEINLRFPVYDDKYKIIKDESRWSHKKTIKARELWDKVMTTAYNTGEIGVLFYDNMNKDNNTWYTETITHTNPCGEYLAGTVFGQELDSSQYGGSCNLGSVFLHYLVKNPFTDKAYLDMDLLKKAVYDGVEFLDNVIDVNNFPSPIYENYQKNFRTIGLGITGLANAMAMLNIKYGSMKSHNFVKKLMNDIAKFAYTKSIDMAVEKGSFPFLDREKFIQSGFIQKHVDSDAEWGTIAKEIVKYGIRNARILSVAPTGTLSLTFGNNCSSGIEPTFSLEYDRKVKIGGQDESDIQIIKMQDYAYGLWKETTVDNIVNEEIFVTAMNLDVSSHIEILEIVAFHTDMSVSKTVNIPTEYSFEKTKEVYTDCWKSGIKGCTIFRPNEIRQGILISENSTPKEKPISTNTSTELKRGDIICVSDDLLSFKRTIVNGCGKFYIHCDFDEYSGEPLETFIEVGSGGTCERNIQFISRLISLLLRAGVPIEEIVDQARSIRPCKAYTDRTRTKGDTSKGVSCPSAIGHALTDLKNKINERVFNDYEIESFLTHEDTEHKCNGKCDGSCDTVPQITSKDICPECGNTLRNEGGCVICLGGETGGCGWTKCD